MRNCNRAFESGRKLFFKLFSLLFFLNFTLCWGELEPSPQIYNPTQTSPSTASIHSSTNSIQRTPSVQKKTVLLPLNEDEKPPDRKSYQVKRGDTLWRISKNTGISISQLKRFNQLKSDQIQIGQRLILEDDPLEIRRAIPIEKETKALKETLKVADLTPPAVEEIQEILPPAPANPIVSALSPSESQAQSPPAKKEGAKPAALPLTLKERFLGEIRKMIADRVRYNESWRPEGSSKSWVMDCSNTTRFLFHKLFKIDIGRTASEQYYRLKGKGAAWEVPLDSSGRPDTDYLHANLKEGDLLFWEHTYSPDREPPITHVTVYLGTDEEGRFLMVGSEQGKGLLGPDFNGPDLYYFNPLAQKGGHHQFLFFGWKPGRFVAYGRPLSVDR